jgi:diguanylate cyclase
MLAQEVWQRRHRVIVRVAALQAVAIAVYGWCRGTHVEHAVLEGLLVAAPLPIAALDRLVRCL